MSSPALRTVARTRAWDGARTRSIARQLERFRPEIREAVAAQARRHPRLAELALSFPALLAALAWPNGRFDRQAAIASVIAGAPLEALADAARLPPWLRKLEPEAIVAPLPDMPDGEEIRRRIANHLPAHPAYAAQWFQAVSAAHRWHGDAFALWCAREFAVRLQPRPRGRHRRATPYAVQRLSLLCLWAWYSGKDHPASRLIRTPWSPEMGLKAAMRAIADWWAELEVELAFSGRPIGDVWFAQRHRDGYEFVPLTCAADLVAEAATMQNCVRGYGPDLVDGERRLFSLRKDGVRVATLCTAWSGGDPFPEIEQLTLAANAKAPPELWWLAHQWLRAHDLKRMARTEFDVVPQPPARDAWAAMWKPYWLAMGRVPDWLPLTPTRDALTDL